MRLFLTSLILASGIASAQSTSAPATATPWQMNAAGGAINLSGTGVDLQRTHGNPSAYKLASIPAISDSKWTSATVDANGQVNMRLSSTLSCFNQVDFTYFRTWVYIPKGGTTNLKVTVGSVDDGARMYIFNSKHPATGQTGDLGGFYVPAQDGKLAGQNFKVDFTNEAVAGEANLVMIVQFDDCQIQNNLTGGIEIRYNDQVVQPSATTPVPTGTSYGTICGNGVVDQTTELCDLGAQNGVAGSGCQSSCTLQPGVTLNAKIHEHCNIASAAQTYTQDSASLNWDSRYNAPSYVELAPHTGVNLFTGANFTGQKLSLTSNASLCDQRYPDSSAANDRVGSLQLFYVP